MDTGSFRDPFPGPAEQLLDEPDAAFAAFRLYASVGPSYRDLARVAHLAAVDLATVTAWSTAYRWTDRARIRDITEADQYAAEFEAGRRRVLDRLAELRRLRRDAS